MERASILSAIATGHEVTLFSYEPERLKACDLPITLEDATKLIPRGALPATVESRPNALSNVIRLQGMQIGYGTWFDTDVIFLRALPPDAPYLFGFEDEKVICGALLRLPPDSDLLKTYLAFCWEQPDCIALPWWPLPRRVNAIFKYYHRLLSGRKLPKIQNGPLALTHFIEVHSLATLAAPRTVFYPVHYNECKMFAIPGGTLDDLVKPETLTVHLWHAAYRRQVGMDPPPPDSWLGKKCRELGV
jgi:hypothetical protein